MSESLPKSEPSESNFSESERPVEVLVVEDEAIVALELERRLKALGYQVAGPLDTGEAAVAHTRDHAPDLVLMDVRLAGEIDGIEAAARIRERTDRPVVFLTAYSDEETLDRAKDVSPFGYVVKPFEERDLYAAIEVALSKHGLERRLRTSRENLRHLLDGLRLGTILTGPGGEVLFLNHAARRLLGRDEDPTGRPWREVFPLSDNTLDTLERLTEASPDTREKMQVRLDEAAEGPFVADLEVYNDPYTEEHRIFALYDVTEVHALRRRLDEEARFHDLIGQSDAMQEVFQQIRQVADVRSTALIEGETGTGKELVARALHATGPRQEAPFVVVNCAALNEELAASQLFGHTKGAFTGASTDREGYFEAAGGGTLFLDEIGDVPLEVQVNLLRVLEERTVTRVGETKPRAVDVRVIAATHRNLHEEAEAGRFRKDLLYRIRVARLKLPPLRARRTDIPLLVPAFLKQSRAATGKDVHEVSQQAMRYLLSYDWPGNVRELRNAIEYGLIRCTTATLQADDLPPEIQRDEDEPTATRNRLSDDLPDDEAERIRAALEAAGGNRTEAAKLLDISRATLYRRLDEHNIQ